MDDKIITIDMPWTTIRATSEAALSEYILKQMREARKPMIGDWRRIYKNGVSQ
jgi:hypothetical protein